MNFYLKTVLLFFVLAVTSSPLVNGQGIDELMNVLETQEELYQDLTDYISQLPDHLLESSNELDSKGEELLALSRDIESSLSMAVNQHEEMQNEMDSFLAGCEAMLEEKCMEQEKQFEKFFWKIEPVVELGEEVVFVLDQIDNRYDEKFLLETFKEAEKASLKVVHELADLRADLIKLSEKCE